MVKHLFYSSRLFTSQKRTAVATDKPQGTEYTGVANGEVIADKWESDSMSLGEKDFVFKRLNFEMIRKCFVFGSEILNRY